MLFNMRKKPSKRRNNYRTVRNPLEPELLVSSAAGIYVPQMFAEQYLSAGTRNWEGISAEDRKILLAGPDHEWYWETWDSVEGSARTKANGVTYYLYQDGDLWAVPENFDLEKAGWV